MSQFLQVIMASMASVLFSSAVTFVITVLWNKNGTIQIIKRFIKTHNEIYHKEDPIKIIHDKIQKLEGDINAELKEQEKNIEEKRNFDREKIESIANQLSAIRAGLAFVVGKMDGDPDLFGLK